MERTWHCTIPNRTSTRAQAGVGTLVILIAAMLIAALTVGVFFETAGTFQTETEDTSDDVTDQLTGRLEVIAVSGQVANGSTIELVNITVKSADGRAIDLQEGTIQWVGPSGSASLVWAGKRTNGPTFGITMVESSTERRVLTGETDRATLTVDPGNAINATTRINGTVVDIGDTGPGLQPGERVLVELLTESSTSYRITVPDRLSDNETVSL